MFISVLVVFIEIRCWLVCMLLLVLMCYLMIFVFCRFLFRLGSLKCFMVVFFWFRCS